MNPPTAAAEAVRKRDANPSQTHFFTGADGLRFGISRTDETLKIHFKIAGEKIERRTIFLAFGQGTDRAGAAGSAVLPFARQSPSGSQREGSTVFLPFRADHLYAADLEGATVVSAATKREWNKTAWGQRRECRHDEFGCNANAQRDEFVFDVPLHAFGDAPGRIACALYAKDLAQNGGWGWFYGCSDPTTPTGTGDKCIAHYLELDFSEPGSLKIEPRGRLGAANAERVRIYQLFPRLFGNTNETRKPNGTLAENGVGKFQDIGDAALRSLRELGFTHLWLTGVLRQITATDYVEIGLPADDPDLLKGLAGSPYAIKDCFDVCPDYAVKPAERLVEFRALLDRIHAHGLKVMIDFVPNHVARSYNSTVQPELNFGTRGRGGRGDDAEKFFFADNNFFYLPQSAPGGGPPLRLPTIDPKTKQPISPTCKVLGAGDGLFDGECEHGRVTGNNVVSWQPSLSDWYETVKLNYGFDFTDPKKSRREYPHGTAAADRDRPVPDTWRKMDAVLAHWQALGVDGFRCDMAHMIPPEFWHWAIGRARERQPDVFFVAEAYDNDPTKVPGSDPVVAELNGGKGNVMFDLLNAGFNAVYDDPSYKVLKRLYEADAWANDLDGAHGGSNGAREFIFQNSLRYAENHDEVRLAAPSQWGGIGPDVGKPVAAILYMLSRGPTMLYSGQEVGEPALGVEGFGGDDARTSIFDYWSMPELAKWVNGGACDGGRLSEAQKSLRAFYGRLLRLVAEPAFAAGEFFPLNPANRDNPRFGRLGGETASGHWLYAFLRYDHGSGQRMLVVVNLHRSETLRGVQVRLTPDAVVFLEMTPANAAAKRFSAITDRLCANDARVEATIDPVTRLHSVTIPAIPPLTPCVFELAAE